MRQTATRRRRASATSTASTMSPAPAAVFGQPMLDLSFARSNPVVLPPWERLDLVQVGAGGTGSFATHGLARIVAMLREQGREVRYSIVDPDIVEDRNLARQNFVPAEVGASKAAALAVRYCRQYPIEVRAVLQRFTKEAVGAHLHDLHTYEHARELVLLIGCVDNAAARQALTECLSASPGRDAYGWRRSSAPHSRVWYVDAGNSAGGDPELSGQILVMSTLDEERLQRAFDLPGSCRELPGLGFPMRGVDPEAQEPYRGSLLVPRPEEDEALRGCVIVDQHLFINQLMAALLTQTVYALLQHELRTFAIDITPRAGRMDSAYTTPEGLARTLGRPVSWFAAPTSSTARTQ